MATFFLYFCLLKVFSTEIQDSCERSNLETFQISLFSSIVFL